MVVFGAMIYSLVSSSHRRRGRQDHVPQHQGGNHLDRDVFILVAWRCPPGSGSSEIPKRADGHQVTGYQWKWEYGYLGRTAVLFDSSATACTPPARSLSIPQVPHYLLDVDNALVIPAGTKIRFLLTAQDVIHAWWVPAFGMKKDAIPGYVNEIWVQVDADKTGVYRGQCAELCGRDHGFMPIVVEVKSPADFDAWLRAKQTEQKLAGVAPSATAAVETAVASTAPAVTQQ